MPDNFAKASSPRHSADATGIGRYRRWRRLMAGMAVLAGPAVVGARGANDKISSGGSASAPAATRASTG
jgi:hypothetical protein